MTRYLLNINVYIDLKPNVYVLINIADRFIELGLSRLMSDYVGLVSEPRPPC